MKQTSSDGQQLGISPSKRIRLGTHPEGLVVKGRRTVNPFAVALYFLPWLGASAILWWRPSSSPFVPVVVGFLSLVYAAYVVNVARKATTLHLMPSSADLTEVGLLWTSGAHVRLDTNAPPTVEMKTLEDGDMYFLRLKVFNEPDLEVLRGHTEEDLKWLCEQIQRWQRGRAA